MRKKISLNRTVDFDRAAAATSVTQGQEQVQTGTEKPDAEPKPLPGREGPALWY